jgi:hypothetical protein
MSAIPAISTAPNPIRPARRPLTSELNMFKM